MERVRWPLSKLIRELARAPDETLPAAWKHEPRPGSRVGRFEIVREIGRGGFGTVYEAMDAELGRRVALKAVRPRRTGPQIGSEWLIREAEAVARLDHPCIVTLFDVGTSDAGPYLVMELLHGETLSQRLGKGPVTPSEALRISRQVAEGLAHAHGRGILHRDLKPANVFLCEDGRVKLLDFGLAHLLGKGGSQGAGTPGYMPPEQERGEPVDSRADVFAAAVTLREMLTGERTAGGADEGAVPRPVARALARGMSADPAARPMDGAEWLAVLRRAQEALERPRRLRRLGAVMGMSLAVGAVVAVLAARNGKERGDGPQDLEVEGRTVVAVADVANGTEERDLEALGPLLATSLEQSRKLIVLTRGRLSDAARKLGIPGGSIDEVAGRKVARIAGASILLIPTVHRLGTTYVLELRALDLQSDRYRFALKDAATDKDDLAHVVDRLSDRARQELRESAEDVAGARVEVGDAITRSLEAHQHYLLGRALRLQQCDYVAAEREQRQAIEDDPQSAEARLELGVLILLTGGSRAESNEQFKAAHRLASRTPEKERRMFELDELVTPTVPVPGNREEQKALVRKGIAELDARFPGDEAVLQFGAMASYMLGDWEQSLDRYLRSLEIDPGQCYVVGYATGLLRRLGRFDEVAALARRAVEANPNAANRALLASALVQGEPREAARQAREALQLATGGQVDAVSSAACALLEAGLPGEAATAARNLALDGVTPQARRSGRGLSSAILAAQGRRREALQEFDRMEPRRIGPFIDQRATILAVGRVGHRAPEALAELRKEREVALRPGELALYGDMVGADRASADLEAGSLPEAHYRAIRAAVEEGPERAIPALRRLLDLATNAPGGFGGLRAAVLHEATLLLGEALLASGSVEEAEAVLRSGDRLGSCSFQGAAHVPGILVARARANERLGRPAEAVAILDRLLVRWKDDEPGLPLHEVAASMRARLAAATR